MGLHATTPAETGNAAQVIEDSDDDSEVEAMIPVTGCGTTTLQSPPTGFVLPTLPQNLGYARILEQHTARARDAEQKAQATRDAVQKAQAPFKPQKQQNKEP